MRITDFSLDLETMGVGRDAAICQIGICAFNRDTAEVAALLSIDVQIQDAVDQGGVINPSTVGWWASQGGFGYSGEIYSVKEALSMLSEHIGSSTHPLWVKGEHFDISILEGYYERLGLPIPWKYNQPRDYRTLADVSKYAYEFEATHNALQDAIDQAKGVCYMLKGPQ